MAKDEMRKSYQQKFNRIIHRLNKAIEIDDLWRGRFYFLQKDARWWRFDDNSGGELILFIRGIDKKTDYYHDYRLNYAPWMPGFYWNLNMNIANDFIVKQVDVWAEDPTPNALDAVDYSKIPIPADIMNKKYNFYLDYSHFED
jgi:hypothetical protein